MNEAEVLYRNTALYRRQFLLILAGSFVACGTKQATTPQPMSTPSTTPTSTLSQPTSKKARAFFADWKDLSFAATQESLEERALVMVPKGNAKLPVLVALHGYGESRHGLEFGAKGWRDQYDLDLVHERLSKPPLVSKDARELITPERLAQLNTSLQRDPYQGLVVACPYTPSLSDKSPGGAEEFGRFLTQQLLPRVHRETSCLTERTQTGINGVSMGGRLSLLVGLTNPEVFGVVGSLQTAMKSNEAPLFVKLVKSALKKAPIQLRLVSSEEDPFLSAMSVFHELLNKEKIEHSFYVTPGPHDYIWNQGPGAIEMLTWHERIQRNIARQ